MPLDLPAVELVPESADDLRARWQGLKVSQPRLRARDAAEMLGVSEAELVAAQCGVKARSLTMDVGKLFEALPSLGRVMALTRNDSCVIERKGTYEPANFGAMAGVTLGDLDLRIFPKQWVHLFAVSDESATPPRRSLQVFNAHGAAVHKIFALDTTDVAAWDKLVDSFAAAGSAIRVTPAEKTERKVNDSPDRAALLADWANIKDVHEFHSVLKKNEVDALQAMQLAEGTYTQRLAINSTNDLLTLASERQVPIMIFVGNTGLIQIFSGNINRIVRMDYWVNVLDPDFNLHLREDHIAHAYAVKKPISGGELHSVELYNAEGGRIATLFGKRKPGEPELEGWSKIVAELPRLKA